MKIAVRKGSKNRTKPGDKFDNKINTKIYSQLVRVTLDRLDDLPVNW